MAFKATWLTVPYMCLASNHGNMLIHMNLYIKIFFPAHIIPISAALFRRSFLSVTLCWTPGLLLYDQCVNKRFLGLMCLTQLYLLFFWWSFTALRCPPRVPVRSPWIRHGDQPWRVSQELQTKKKEKKGNWEVREEKVNEWWTVEGQRLVTLTVTSSERC